MTMTMTMTMTTTMNQLHMMLTFSHVCNHLGEQNACTMLDTSLIVHTLLLVHFGIGALRFVGGNRPKTWRSNDWKSAELGTALDKTYLAKLTK
eukprot:2580626-Amphidinium_carterae.1